MHIPRDTRELVAVLLDRVEEAAAAFPDIREHLVSFAAAVGVSPDDMNWHEMLADGAVREWLSNPDWWTHLGAFAETWLHEVMADEGRSSEPMLIAVSGLLEQISQQAVALGMSKVRETTVVDEWVNPFLAVVGERLVDALLERKSE